MKKILAILVLTFSVNFAFAQDVQSVLNRYYAATGLQDIKEELTYKTWKLDVDLDAVFMKINFKYLVNSENSYRVESNVGGRESNCVVVDNGIGWERLLGEVKRLENQNDIEKATNMADVMAMLMLKVDNYNITYIGREGDVEILEFKTKNRSSQKPRGLYAFNTKTGLIDYVDNYVTVFNKESLARCEYKDYKQFGKYTFPTTITAAKRGVSFGLKINSFETGCDFDGRLFKKMQ